MRSTLIAFLFLAFVSCDSKPTNEAPPASDRKDSKVDILCVETSRTESIWKKDVKKMAGQSINAPKTPHSVRMVGFDTPKPELIGQNSRSELLLIRDDPSTGTFQYFEKPPLGAPILWSYYPKDSEGQFTLKKDILLRMESYREEVPMARITVYECQ